MVTLSLAMIVRDEAESLGRVLEQASTFCDELVVVDTGSVDGSPEIARDAGARVIDFEWIDDFAAARNVSFDACSTDWIVWLDADDVVPPEAQRAFNNAKAALLNDRIDGVFAAYRYHFIPDTDICTFQFPRERLIRRAAGLRWHGAIHEVLPLFDRPNTTSRHIYVEHRPSAAKRENKGDRNLRIMRRIVAAGDRSSRTLFYFGNELKDNGLWEEAIDAYRDFLEAPGQDWEVYSVHLNLSECAANLGDRDASFRHLLSAIEFDSSRAEAFMRAGVGFMQSEKWNRAVPLLAAATAAVKPTSGFVHEPDYGYLPWDHLALSLHRSGRNAEAIVATNRSLELGNPDRERLQGNLAIYHSSLS